jgi:hypothetical protein
VIGTAILLRVTMKANHQVKVFSDGVSAETSDFFHQACGKGNFS